MPRGQTYTLEGRLVTGDARGLFALRMDNGGTWHLDAPPKMRPLIGQRVQVNGTRSGFDVIDVSEFALAKA